MLRPRPIAPTWISGKQGDLAVHRYGRPEGEELAVFSELLLSERQYCIEQVLQIILGDG